MENFITFLELRGPTQPAMPSDPSANIFTAENIREEIFRCRNLISNFQPRDIEDTKDLLLSLQTVIEDKLTGS